MKKKQIRWRLGSEMTVSQSSFTGARTLAGRREQLGIRDDKPLEVFETPDLLPAEDSYDPVMDAARCHLAPN